MAQLVEYFILLSSDLAVFIVMVMPLVCLVCRNL